MTPSNALTATIESLVTDLRRGVTLSAIKANLLNLGTSEALASTLVRLAEIKA